MLKINVIAVTVFHIYGDIRPGFAENAEHKTGVSNGFRERSAGDPWKGLKKIVHKCQNKSIKNAN